MTGTITSPATSDFMTTTVTTITTATTRTTAVEVTIAEATFPAVGTTVVPLVHQAAIPAEVETLAATQVAAVAEDIAAVVVAAEDIVGAVVVDTTKLAYSVLASPR
jgi:hypothetical protein